MTLADVEKAFGPIASKLAKQEGIWPDAEAVTNRLKEIKARGRKHGQRRSRAAARYDAGCRAEELRRSFIH